MERSTRITLFIVLFAVAGIIVALIGVSYWSEGIAGIKSVNTDPDPALIRSWIPNFRTYLLAGALFALGGLGYLLAAFYLWNAEERGRQLGLYSGAAVILAWGIVKILSLHFRNPPPFGSLLVGLISLYLLTNEFRQYTSSKSLEEKAN